MAAMTFETLCHRVWYYFDKEDQKAKLAYKNFVPRHVNADEKEKSSVKDNPRFEDLPMTVKRMNEELKNNPLNGNLISAVGAGDAGETSTFPSKNLFWQN